MLNTYRAKLKGDRLEWADEPPPTQNGGGTDVLVTVLPPTIESADDRRARGAGMRAALERLAGIGGIQSIPDPVGWQREMRVDRPLPGRED